MGSGASKGGAKSAKYKPGPAPSFLSLPDASPSANGSKRLKMPRHHSSGADRTKTWVDGHGERPGNSFRGGGKSAGRAGQGHLGDISGIVPDNQEGKDLLNVQRAFDAADADGSGEISETEFIKMFRAGSKPGTLPFLRRLFRFMDFDGNGNISFREFVYALATFVDTERDPGEEGPGDVSNAIFVFALFEQAPGCGRAGVGELREAIQAMAEAWGMQEALDPASEGLKGLPGEVHTLLHGEPRTAPGPRGKYLMSEDVSSLVDQYQGAFGPAMSLWSRLRVHVPACQEIVRKVDAAAGREHVFGECRDKLISRLVKLANESDDPNSRGVAAPVASATYVPVQVLDVGTPESRSVVAATVMSPERYKELRAERQSTRVAGGPAQGGGGVGEASVYRTAKGEAAVGHVADEAVAAAAARSPAGGKASGWRAKKGVLGVMAAHRFATASESGDSSPAPLRTQGARGGLGGSARGGTGVRKVTSFPGLPSQRSPAPGESASTSSPVASPSPGAKAARAWKHGGNPALAVARMQGLAGVGGSSVPGKRPAPGGRLARSRSFGDADLRRAVAAAASPAPHEAGTPGGRLSRAGSFNRLGAGALPALRPGASKDRGVAMDTLSPGGKGATHLPKVGKGKGDWAPKKGALGRIRGMMAAATGFREAGEARRGGALKRPAGSGSFGPPNMPDHPLKGIGKRGAAR